MGKRSVSTLVLASSLLLALPPGWCCLLISAPAAARKPAPAAQKSCCMHRSEKQQAPAEKPSIPSKRCPCCDRLSVLTPSASGPQSDGAFSFVAILPVAVSSPAGGTGFWQSGSSRHPPACHVHVCNCIWLC